LFHQKTAMKFLCLSAFLLASSVTSQERIIGGGPAPIDRFEYYTSLYRGGQVARGNFICGGSLIAPDFVITAAHCDPNDFDFRLVVNNHDIDGDETGTPVDVVEKFKHEDWNRRKITDDIMLFRLAEPVTETPITMNFDPMFPDEEQEEREELTAIGLGKTTWQGGLPEKLQFVRKDVYPSEECEARYAPEIGGWGGLLDQIVGFFRDMDMTKQICSGGNGLTSTCQGDSGGPLISEAETSEGDLLVGLTSYGVRGCAAEDFPSVYTRISGYKDWIKTRVCENTRADPKPDYCNGYVPPEPEEESSEGFTFCFSGIDTVEVENVGSVEMKNLKIGDSILVAPNKYESVYSFGHHSDSLKTEFLAIAANNGAKLEVTKDHLVFVEGGNSIPASDLKRGMRLMYGNELTGITSINKVVREGLYAPFTPSGKLVVNGFQVSSFVAINGSATIKLFGMELHYQMISKLFESPRRLVCKVFGQCKGESYNNQGISTWHSVALNAYHWLLDQDPFTFHAGFMLAFTAVSLVSMLEFFVSFSVIVPLALAFVVMSRCSKSKKNVN